MKNITIKMLLLAFCIVSLNLQAQVSPVNKEREVRLAKEKKDYKAKQLKEKESKSIQEKLTYSYIKLEVLSIEDKLIVKDQKLDFDQFSNSETKLKNAKYIFQLRELLTKENFNLVNELGKQGIKIVSHAFSVSEKGEKHIYILEL